MNQIVLLTGFLGAGKTTFLNQILSEFSDSRIGLIVNEFSETGVDGALIRRDIPNTAMRELNNGSIFCACIKDSFVDSLIEMGRMDIDQILSQLSGEKQAGTESGSIDMIWINGENFRSARENGLLYGPFTQSLPSYQQWVDMKDTENQQDFGYPIEGYEAPYGKAQMVLIKDSARTPETPKNAQELLEFVKQYPGQVTYPAPPDFTGSAFVRNIVYELCGDTQFQNMMVASAIIPPRIR